MTDVSILPTDHWLYKEIRAYEEQTGRRPSSIDMNPMYFRQLVEDLQLTRNCMLPELSSPVQTIRFMGLEVNQTPFVEDYRLFPAVTERTRTR